MTEKLLLVVAMTERYISGELSLYDFERWLVPFSWNCHLWVDRQAGYVAEQVGALVCVAGFEGWTKEEEFDELRTVIANLPRCMTKGSGASVTLPPVQTITQGATASFTWWAS